MAPNQATSPSTNTNSLTKHVQTADVSADVVSDVTTGLLPVLNPDLFFWHVDTKSGFSQKAQAQEPMQRLESHDRQTSTVINNKSEFSSTPPTSPALALMAEFTDNTLDHPRIEQLGKRRASLKRCGGT